jgi:HD-GYP domain-containing protein (c-di-GMP phosphodiesterase class II)
MFQGVDNAGFLDCLPMGLVMVDRGMEVVFVNRWLRERAGVVPLRVGPMEAWGDGKWREFLSKMGSMGEAVEGEFVLRLNERVQATVSMHRLHGHFEGAVAVLVSDVSSLRRTQEHLKETLSHLTELSDTMISQSLELKHMNTDLEARVRDRTVDLRRANLDALRMLAVACEAKDRDTGEHVERVRGYTEKIARELGLKEGQVIELGYSSILHDVGKVQVPDAILNKPGPLTAEERAVMQEHAAAGERILGGNPFFAVARRIARGHHENWDGSGYPDHAAGTSIPLEARIVHVADVFDALTSVRSYKKAWTVGEAMVAMCEKTWIHFDGDVVGALEALVSRGVVGSVIGVTEAGRMLKHETAG